MFTEQARNMSGTWQYLRYLFIEIYLFFSILSYFINVFC